MDTNDSNGIVEIIVILTALQSLTNGLEALLFELRVRIKETGEEKRVRRPADTSDGILPTET